MPLILGVSVRRAAGAVLVRTGDGKHIELVATVRWETDPQGALTSLLAAAPPDEPVVATVASSTDDGREELTAALRAVVDLEPLTTGPKATRRGIIGHGNASDKEVDAVLVRAIDGLEAVESATVRDALLAVVWSEQQRRARSLRDDD